MKKHSDGFMVFSGEDVSKYLARTRNKITSQIHQESKDYILNVNETDYVNHLVSKSTVEPIHIDFEGEFISSREKLIPAEHFPSHIVVYAGKHYSKQAIVFHLPYTGNGDLFRYAPSMWSTWAPEVYLENQCLCFEIVDFDDDAERIRKRAKEIKATIRAGSGHLTAKINNHNKQLPNFVKQCFQKRKQTFLDQNQVVAAVGVPVKKQENLPRTYAIPTPGFRKRINVKPRVTEIGYKPEPTLPDSVYHDILQTIHGIGKEFERLPATYSGKGEEALRDHILLVLAPQSDGSVTSETFNKTGKNGHSHST